MMAAQDTPTSAAGSPVSDDGAQVERADIVQIDKALESWRDSGFDLMTALGEVVDNSIEASALHVRVRTVAAGDKAKSVSSIAFSDDGVGIPSAVLPHVLSLGFSTRYNQRSGLGRFGVGLKLAALAYARRLDIYTRQAGEPTVRHAFLDLDLIANGTQTFIVAEHLDEFPDEYADLMRIQSSEDEVAYASGTLVVWNKVDRLKGTGRYETNLTERLNQVRDFFARAYRKFLDSGVSIELNGTDIALHDPTFQLDSPRLIKKFGERVRGEVIARDEIDLEGHKVQITVAIPPLKYIQPRTQGGNRMAEDLRIPENEGKISFLRQGREINYDQVAKMLPGGVKDIDRYVGIEVEFPAALDEYFQVRHVKRGIVPVDKLRDDLRKRLERPVEAARGRVQAQWDVIDAAKRKPSSDHSDAGDAAAAADATTPRGKAGTTLSDDEQADKVKNAAKAIAGSPGTAGSEGDTNQAREERQAETEQQIREALEQTPFPIVDSDWPGKDMFTITHLNNKGIVAINHSNTFIKDVYDPIHDLAARDQDEVSVSDALRVARRTAVGIELLFMAYAKAENLNSNPDEAYSDLRMYWAQAASAYVTQMLKKL